VPPLLPARRLRFCPTREPDPERRGGARSSGGTR